MSTDFSELFESALESHRAGNLEAAVHGYRRILERHPEQPDALNLLALIDLGQGRFESAAGLFRRAIAVAGEVPEFHCQLGNALRGMGRLGDACEAYRRAIALRPEFAEAHNNLGFAFMQQGDLDHAIHCFESALALDADFLFALNNLGDAHVAQGDTARAEQCYRRAIAVSPEVADLHGKLAGVLRNEGRAGEALVSARQAVFLAPDSTAGHYSLALILMDGGEYSEAIEHLWAAIGSDDGNVEAYRALGSLLKESVPSTYAPALEDRLLGFFRAEGVDYSDVTEFTTRFLKLKYGIDLSTRETLDTDALVSRFLVDPLAVAVLGGAVNADVDVERLLTRVRRHCLMRYGSGSEAGVIPWQALSVLALQCINNEHVFAEDEQETRLVTGLAATLEARAGGRSPPDRDIQLDLLLYALYRPLVALGHAHDLAAVPLERWNDALSSVVTRALMEPLEEAVLEATVASVGAVKDALSSAVRTQYEENPYPRWLVPAYRKPASLHAILKSMFVDFEPPAVLKHAIHVLVVGCGTGHHPISIAMRYQNAAVMATDISRRSLAYGLRMAQRLGVGNVRFVQNDLLNLAELEQKFEVIECVGVLHHMRSIETGLRLLVERLSSGGLLKIGLYSRKARAPVESARQWIDTLGLSTSPEDIRRLRHLAMNAGENDPLYGLTEFGDFYTTSNCRDLLLHVHEQSVTLADLRRLLDGANLEFIGFEHGAATSRDAYRRQFPGDRRMGDLSRWEAVESDDPTAFIGMYQCWCRRV